jgi:hypothetical protein
MRLGERLLRRGNVDDAGGVSDVRDLWIGRRGSSEGRSSRYERGGAD